MEFVCSDLHPRPLVDSRLTPGTKPTSGRGHFNTTNATISSARAYLISKYTGLNGQKHALDPPFSVGESDASSPYCITNLMSHGRLLRLPQTSGTVSPIYAPHSFNLCHSLREAFDSEPCDTPEEASLGMLLRVSRQECGMNT